MAYSDSDSDSDYCDQEKEQTIIENVLKNHSILPHNVTSKYDRQGVMGLGRFECDTCDHPWYSGRAHVVISLRTRRVVRRWKQRCQDCDKEEEPEFTESKFKEMVNIAAERYLSFVGGTRKRSSSAVGGNEDPGAAPHMSELCEKCQYGARKCWLKE